MSVACVSSPPLAKQALSLALRGEAPYWSATEGNGDVFPARTTGASGLGGPAGDLAYRTDGFGHSDVKLGLSRLPLPGLF